MGPRFSVFLLVAFLSNGAWASFNVGSAWVFGSPELPLWFPILGQIQFLLGTLIGAPLGARLTRRSDFVTAAAIGSFAQAAVFLLGAAALLLLGSSGGDAVVALPTLAIAFFGSVTAGVAAPAWMAVVYSWPGPTSADQRIMQDSAVFQLAKSLGPLAGAAMLTAFVAGTAIGVLSIVNAATFVLVGAYLLLVRRRHRFGIDTAHTVATASRSRWPRAVTAPVAVLALSALAFDAARTYLPRLAREAGMSEFEFGAVLSSIAVGAAIAGFALGRMICGWSLRGRVVIGAALLVASLLTWFVTEHWLAWAAAGLVGGVGLSLSNAAATRWHILLRERIGQASAEIRMIRTLAGAGGGLLVALALAVGWAPLLGPVIFSFATLAVAGRSRAAPSS